MPKKKNQNDSVPNVSSSKRGRPKKVLILEEDPPVSEAKRTLEALEHNRKQMLEMQNKILSAPAMNGGFSTLMYKIEKIEQSQDQLVEKVDEIRDVMYDPDSGLYARIKNIENSVVEEKRIESLEEEVRSIKSWKNLEEKSSEKDETHTADIEKKIEEHAEVIKDLKKWYERQAAATKWLAITVGTGLLGGFGKIIYEFLISHIKFV